MIRSMSLAMALVALTTASASAQNALSFWDGVAVIDSVSAACRNTGTPPGSSAGFVAVNNVFSSSYRARLDPNDPNQPSSGITFVTSRSMQSYFKATNQEGDNANDQMNGKGTYALRVLRGNVTSTPGANNPNPCSGKFTFKIKPNVIAADTDSITIDGTISDWRCTPGCTVKFRGAYRANPFNAVP